MRAVDAKKVTSLAAVATAMKRKLINVRLNLDTAAFEVTTSKDVVSKTITPKKGYDAVYVVNKTNEPEDLKAATTFLKGQRDVIAGHAAEFETQFSEKQDELLKAIGIWRETDPGAARRDLSIEIGRLQNELSVLENKLRESQYQQRKAMPVEGLKRRVFVPMSFDDRVMPHPVYKLLAAQTAVGLRVMPIK